MHQSPFQGEDRSGPASTAKSARVEKIQAAERCCVGAKRSVPIPGSLVIPGIPMPHVPPSGVPCHMYASSLSLSLVAKRHGILQRWSISRSSQVVGISRRGRPWTYVFRTGRRTDLQIMVVGSVFCVVQDRDVERDANGQSDVSLDFCFQRKRQKHLQTQCTRDPGFARYMFPHTTREKNLASFIPDGGERNEYCTSNNAATYSSTQSSTGWINNSIAR